MVKRSLFFLFGVLFLIGCASTGTAQENGTEPATSESEVADEVDEQTLGEYVEDEIEKIEAEESAFQEVTAGDFLFRWRIDEDDLLHVRVTAPTTGWVSVGFAPSTMMKDANLIIGYVAEDELQIRDEFGTGVTAHKPDIELGGTDDINESSGIEEDGSTMIHFTIPLDSRDDYDRVLVRGQTYKVIFAYGRSDDFTSYHAGKGSVNVTF